MPPKSEERTRRQSARYWTLEDDDQEPGDARLQAQGANGGPPQGHLTQPTVYDNEGRQPKERIWSELVLIGLLQIFVSVVTSGVCSYLAFGVKSHHKAGVANIVTTHPPDRCVSPQFSLGFKRQIWVTRPALTEAFQLQLDIWSGTTPTKLRRFLVVWGPKGVGKSAALYEWMRSIKNPVVSVECDRRSTHSQIWQGIAKQLGCSVLSAMQFLEESTVPFVLHLKLLGATKTTARAGKHFVNFARFFSATSFVILDLSPHALDFGILEQEIGRYSAINVPDFTDGELQSFLTQLPAPHSFNDARRLIGHVPNDLQDSSTVSLAALQSAFDGDVQKSLDDLEVRSVNHQALLHALSESSYHTGVLWDYYSVIASSTKLHEFPMLRVNLSRTPTLHFRNFRLFSIYKTIFRKYSPAVAVSTVWVKPMNQNSVAFTVTPQSSTIDALKRAIKQHYESNTHGKVDYPLISVYADGNGGWKKITEPDTALKRNTAKTAFGFSLPKQ